MSEKHLFYAITKPFTAPTENEQFPEVFIREFRNDYCKDPKNLDTKNVVVITLKF